MTDSDTPPLPQCAPPHPTPSTPQTLAPLGAWDCHAHIFGPVERYPLHPTRSYDPAPASLEAYRNMLSTLNIEHAVIVQPSIYGTDNRCTADALRSSDGAWRGVAVVDAGISTHELQNLHALGFRGVRFNLLFMGGTALDQLETIACKIAPLGWHVQLLLDGRELPALAPRLARLPTPYVIDHMGHFPTIEGIASAAMKQLLPLLESGRCWAKLSGPYRLVPGEHPYPGTVDIARALVERAPHRLVWGSDWPHPSIRQAVPDDGRLFELLDAWVTDRETRQRILVDNPRELYDA
ncbi:MAG: amidohydrolase family protein [Acidihalobacter sp.]|uniref:amidohydrolase family protein n=1 Tax=Acidihalobacter sp. TaxID=1872108 RepID=UPI00307F06B3